VFEDEKIPMFLVRYSTGHYSHALPKNNEKGARSIIGSPMKKNFSLNDVCVAVEVLKKKNKNKNNILVHVNHGVH
jgi:3-deoxy-D-arabino-heptulosonate 7-phosphate (DAHP) synthase